MRSGGTSADVRVQRDQLDRARRGIQQAAEEDVLIEGDRRLMLRSADGSQFMVRVDDQGFLFTAEADGTEHPLTIAAVSGLADALKIRSVTVATLPDPTDASQLPVLVTDESGGKVLAFAEGTHWRRVTDRAIVS